LVQKRAAVDGRAQAEESQQAARLFLTVHPAQALGFPEQRQRAARGDDDASAVWFADAFEGVSAATSAAS